MTGDQPSEDAAQARERRIRERAYWLWEIEGRKDGKQDEDWQRACELIEAENQTAYPPSQSRPNRT